MATTYLQPGQIEAHISRLTAVRTQLAGYAETDGRAAEAMPLIDTVIGSLQQEPFDTPKGVEAAPEAAEVDPDDLPFE